MPVLYRPITAMPFTMMTYCWNGENDEIYMD